MIKNEKCYKAEVKKIKVGEGMAPINPTISSLVATRAVAEIMRTHSSHLEDISYHHDSDICT